MSQTQIHTTVDFSAPHGKQCGHLAIPYSHNLGGWANLQIPISLIRNGAGPVVLLMAGNHGDEYPGPIAILKLLRELTPEECRARSSSCRVSIPGGQSGDAPFAARRAQFQSLFPR